MKLLREKIKISLKWLFISLVMLHFIFFIVGDVGFIHGLKSQNQILLKIYFNNWVGMNILFTSVIIFILFLEFKGFLINVDKNNIKGKSCEWLKENKNLSFVIKISFITLPFSIFLLLKIFLSELIDVNFNSYIIIINLICLGIISLTGLVMLYFYLRAWILLMPWLEYQSKEFYVHLKNLYLKAIFLKQTFMKLLILLLDFNLKIFIFLLSNQHHEHLNIAIIKATFLNNFKKTSTPPVFIKFKNNWF